MRIAVTFIAACLLLSASEPSVYTMGAYDSDKELKATKRALLQLRQKVARLEEKVQGLQSIIEGLSARMESYARQTSLKSDPDDVAMQTLLRRLEKVEEALDSKRRRRQHAHSQESAQKNLSSSQTETFETLGKKAPRTLYSEGVRLFGKKRYDEAKKRFEITDEQGYKAAASNYYLGEIAYYTKRYEDAIFYYKKSAGLNDKAGYIDVLLLHAAIALEKTGQASQAKRFYKNIIANYPHKKSAAIAKKRLDKMQ